MRVLITGGAGFIGGNLARELRGLGHDVIVLDNLSTGRLANVDERNTQVVLGSILDEELMTWLADDADAIVHLAARSSVPRSIDDPVATHLANASGTLTVLEAARKVGGRHVVMSSSSSVYGANDEIPKRETGATIPMSPYAASKLAAESYALAYGKSFGLPVLAFRFFNVFGPLQPAGHAYAAVIPTFIDAALRGRTIHVHGDGTQSRDFTHVSTVCRTITTALERGVTSPGPVNLAFGSRIDLNSLLARLADRIDRPLVIENVASRIGDVPHSQADATLLRSLFPEVEPVEFDAGLDQTIAWMIEEIARTDGVINLSPTLDPRAA